VDNISEPPVEQGRADQQDHAATVPLVHNERPSTRISCGAGTAARTRTSNQTVMSGPVSPESSNKIDVFRGVRARSFASVHGVSVVYLWSVPAFP
jgi:hypothetical protein